jgi:plastocyanin
MIRILLLLALFGCAGKSHRVDIRDMKFIPAELEVKKGDNVVFVNHDLVNHNVTDASGGNWSSSVLAPDSSWTYKAIENADYYCSFHPVMKGKIVIR